MRHKHAAPIPLRHARARVLYHRLSVTTRYAVYETLGCLAARDRTEQAVRYLADPVHAAQFTREVSHGY